MYCKKCKFHSFDHVSKCPKCGADWEESRKALYLNWITASGVNWLSPELSAPQAAPAQQGKKVAGTQSPFAFKKRSDLLASYRPAHHELLPLQDFATWAASVNLSPIPTELAVHAIQDTDQTTEVPTEPEQAKNETQEGITPEDELAALFEPVSVAALEKMFPDNGRWRNHAERAARNGLSVAREDRGKFNPYLAAIWWLNKKKPSGWDLARVHRTLANNLPARSLDSKHFLIGEIE